MKRPDTIMIEGRAYSWRAILELRRAQLEAWKAAQPTQPALFKLQEDRRQLAERIMRPKQRSCVGAMVNALRASNRKSRRALSRADLAALDRGCGRVAARTSLYPAQYLPRVAGGRSARFLFWDAGQKGRGRWSPANPEHRGMPGYRRPRVLVKVFCLYFLKMKNVV